MKYCVLRSQCEMKFALTFAKQIFHSAAISHGEAIFHSPKANFVEKSTHCLGRQMCAFFWQITAILIKGSYLCFLYPLYLMGVNLFIKGVHSAKNMCYAWNFKLARQRCSLHLKLHLKDDNCQDISQTKSHIDPYCSCQKE